MIDELPNQLVTLSNAADAEFLQRFFKTGPGQYGEGDLFRGIRVPVLRRLSVAYQTMPQEQVVQLLHSAYHEDRLLALFILVRQYAKADQGGREAIYELYLGHTRYINNWDLVDASAEHIVGAWLFPRSHQPVDKLSESDSMWERRISIMATFHFIKRRQFATTLRIAAKLLSDQEDLIHKAVGWMLREVGKRDLAAEETFLQGHYRQMPRTMLRYAIEKFPEDRRQKYLQGAI